MKTKLCFSCGEIKIITAFRKRKDSLDGHTGRCSDCLSTYQRNYRKLNPELMHKIYIRKMQRNPHKGSEASKRSRDKCKLETFTYYANGTPICACCGEKIFEFLCIDHIEGGGGKQRKLIGHGGSGFYSWLKKNNYPKGYRVLCHNCNQSLGSFGYCPHQKEKV